MSLREDINSNNNKNDKQRRRDTNAQFAGISKALVQLLGYALAFSAAQDNIKPTALIAIK